MHFKLPCDHNRVLSKCLGITGLILLLVGLYDNSWVLLQLLLVPRCGGKTPVQYETDCVGLHYNPQDVARAGLWEVCHFFPFGYIPEFYYHTEPYCSKFSDDEEPAEWLDTAQFLCQLAVALNVAGMLACVLADIVRSRDICDTGSIVLVISAACGLLGLTKYYSNISKAFLIPYKRNIVSMYANRGTFYFIQGCAMTLVAGLLQARIKL
ncbi:unnamed protein product [Candidula unifasciata]|uniref:Uncharacterized protein n=1 Tax=Candidula unifasciata TaxID=100452 RepID=A0A8S3Z6A0_9EUPU|nr:unnamed protein product [Candidula unifasciata]